MPKMGGDLKSKSRSRRKPLRDVSNGGFRYPPVKSVINKSIPATTCGGGGGGGGFTDNSIDRLLLVHSDLSVLIHQIDELVVQAVEQKMSPKEIESFAHVLQDMQTSLKPWVSRFQKVLPTGVTKSENQMEASFASMKITPSINKNSCKVLESPNVDKFDFMVSPSPLVSWRADCAPEGGRNLFLLTPLPKPTPFTSKLKKSSKLVFETITSDVTVDDPVAKNPNVFSSPEKPARRNDSIIVSTPYLKMSPPKSCKLLEPASISTKHPTIHRTVGGGESGDSEPSSIQPSGHLALKYPELFGIKPAHKLVNARKVVEASPGWGMSPPKSCVFLEPSDERDAGNLTIAGGIPSVSHNRAVIESTPMCKDLDTTILKGKRAGENTLKKELWMRFEAATAHGVHFKASVDQKTINDNHTNKGFLDLLEEVSCDDVANSNV